MKNSEIAGALIMSDHELLELAAKAAGYQIEWVSTRLDGVHEARLHNNNPYWFNWPIWNPLTDDGDALRLAMLLRLTVEPNTSFMKRVSAIRCFPKLIFFAEDYDSGNDICQATRRAIVRTAAEIGKAKP